MKKRTLEIKQCPSCKEKKPIRTDCIFCSPTCAGQARIGTPAPNRGLNYGKKFVCEFCGKDSVVVRSEYKGRFCSLACSRHKSPFNKGKPHLAKEKHPMWKGGTILSAQGYVKTRTETGIYQNVHRLMMQLAIGRKLQETEVVHHWDKNKENNSLDNLSLFRSQSAHKRLHHFARRHGIVINLIKFNQPWLYA
jgi:hypothetical protein